MPKLTDDRVPALAIILFLAIVAGAVGGALALVFNILILAFSN